VEKSVFDAYRLRLSHLPPVAKGEEGSQMEEEEDTKTENDNEGFSFNFNFLLSFIHHIPC